MQAVISDCGKYRYQLKRQTGLQVETAPAVFIMLNPSTADENVDDPTIRRCIGFARSWGYSCLTVLNLFAFRATFPNNLFKAENPVGDDNKDWFRRTFENGYGIVVCAWGNHGSFMGQDLEVMGWLDELGIAPVALKISRTGQPVHPLYMPYEITTLPYEGRRWKAVKGKSVLIQQPNQLPCKDSGD